MAFDQMQMHADLKVVNGDSANAALEKVMGMLGGNPAAIEAAKKAAAAAIQGTLATGEDAEAAQRNAIAAQLGRNADNSPSSEAAGWFNVRHFLMYLLYAGIETRSSITMSMVWSCVHLYFST